MIYRILFILFSICGIGATFLPWVYYPKTDMSLYGYMGDGILTALVFLLILLYSLLTLKKGKIQLFWAILMALFSLGIVVIFYAKNLALEAEKLNFQTDDIGVALATAGFHQGIGLYLAGIAGLGILITSLAALFDYGIMNRGIDIKAGKQFNRSSIFTAIGALAIIAVLTLTFFQTSKSFQPKKAHSIESIIRTDISEMGMALAKGDYDAFLEFNHPTIIQGFGGRVNMQQMLENAMHELNSTGTSFQTIEFKKMNEIHRVGKLFQVIIEQEVTMKNEGREQLQLQKLLAVSEDGGVKWYYINIENKTREEVLESYPYLINELTF